MSCLYRTLITTVFALFTSKASADTIRSCSTTDSCSSETIDCDPICAISCHAYGACHSLIINVPTSGSFTFISTNYSYGVTINAQAAAFANISCIDHESCSDFDVYAAGDVYIEARGINAMPGFESTSLWDLTNVSSAAITCASYESGWDNACNSPFALPDRWRNPAAVVAFYCYGDGCMYMDINVENGLNKNTSMHLNGCGGTEYASASACVSVVHIYCAFTSGCSFRGQVWNDIRCEDNDEDMFFGDDCDSTHSYMYGEQDWCGCLNLLPATFVNEKDDKCVYGDDDDNVKANATVSSTSAIAIVLGCALCYCLCIICIVFCMKCGRNGRGTSKYVQPTGGAQPATMQPVAQPVVTQPQQVVMQQQQQVMMVQPQQPQQVTMMQQPVQYAQGIPQQVQYVQNVPQQQVQYYPQQQTVSQPLQSAYAPGSGGQEGGITHQ